MNKHTLISGVVLLGSISCFCGSSYGSFQSQGWQELEASEVADPEIQRLRQEMKNLEIGMLSLKIEGLEVERLRQEAGELGQEFQELQRKFQRHRQRLREIGNRSRLIEKKRLKERGIPPSSRLKQEFSGLVGELREAIQKGLFLSKEKLEFEQKQLELNRKLERLMLEQERMDPVQLLEWLTSPGQA